MYILRKIYFAGLNNAGVGNWQLFFSYGQYSYCMSQSLYLKFRENEVYSHNYENVSATESEDFYTISL